MGGTWGDPVVIWSEAVVELLRWRRERRLAARRAAELVAGAEAFLAGVGAQPPPHPRPA